MTIKIDEEFKNLIPPLSDTEFKQLEENILRDGIREPLVIWHGTLIDGHNRYAIASKHNLHFSTVEVQFDDRNAAIEWIVQNQFGRRNISTYDRVSLALKLKPVIAEKARARMTAGVAVDPTPNSAQGTTNEQIAKIAGVGKETVRKVEFINQHAPEYVIDFLKRGEMSIQMAFETAQMTVAKLEEHTRKINEKIAAGNDCLAKAVHRLQWLKSNQPPAEYQALIQKQLEISADELEKSLIAATENYNVPAPLKQQIQQLAATMKEMIS